MTQFTASEVRELAATIWPDLSGREEVAEALNAYADLLEAQEKAKPVATVEDQFGFPIMEWIGDAGEKCPVGTNLYAHSAQAQPPASSVTDAIARRMVAEYDAVLCGDPTATRTDGMRAALEAVWPKQPNPRNQRPA